MVISDKVQLPESSNWEVPEDIKNHPYRQYGFNPQTIYFGCAGQYDIPRWKEGGINTQLCAVYLDDSKLGAPFKKGMEMVSTFHRTIESEKDLILCTSAQDIRRAKAEGKIGWVLSFEGCEALGDDISMLRLYHKLGLRVVSLTHTRSNVFAEGCLQDEEGTGLTELGKQLIQSLTDLNIVIDLVHIGKRAFWDVMDLVDQPIILSHSTSTMFASTEPRDKNLLNGMLPRPRLEFPRDREMLQAIANNKGVLGMIWLLYKDIDEAIKDIEVALEIMGEDHIGLGSDLYGYQLATPGLEDISKLPTLVGALIKRGHSDETIIKFLGDNYLRVFESVWKK